MRFGLFCTSRLSVVLALCGIAGIEARSWAVPPFHAPADTFPCRVYPTGGAPAAVGAGDLDSDSDLDVAVANASLDVVDMYSNRDDGTFQRIARIPVGDEPRDLGIGDIDGDDDLDILVVNGLGDSVSVLRNLGGGKFAAATSFGAGDDPVTLRLGDIDGDGALDIAVGFGSGGTMRIWKNDGTGAFAVHGEYAATYFRGLADMDGDGDLDAVGANANGIGVMVNDGTGAFSPGPEAALGFAPDVVALRDFDGDGRMDCAGAQALADRLAVVLRTAAGGFAAPTSYPKPFGAVGLLAGDLGPDAHPDLVVLTEQQGSELCVYRNLGDGGFEPGSVHAIGASLRAGVLGDFDGDGAVDATVVDLGTDLPDQPLLIAGRMIVARGTGNGRFLTQRTHSVFSYAPRDVVAGDLDGDGDPDVVAPNAFAEGSFIGSCVVFENAGGELLPPVSFDAGGRAARLRLADLDGDHDLDIVVANSAFRHLQSPSYFSDCVGVLENNGAGGFGAPVQLIVGESPEAVEAGDIDADGDPDLLVVAYGNGGANIPGGLYVVRNHGDGTFDAPETVIAGSMSQITAGDLDGDTDLDVVVADAENQSTIVLLNAGDGTLTELEGFSVGGLPASLTLGDLNADGALDLVAPIQAADRLSILFGVGDGTFADPVSRVIGSRPSDAAIADIDGDGSPDLVVTLAFGHATAVVLNRGDGTFGASQLYSSSPYPNAVSVVDLDSDTDPDVVTACGDFGFDIGVLENQRIRRPSHFCPADVDGDGYVNASDFSILAVHFGESVAPGAHGDLNGDGAVDIRDFLVLAAGFGCGP